METKPQEDNFHLTGDEARMLMLLLGNSQVSLPSGPALQLYMRLSEISQVQPGEMKNE